MGRKKHRGLSLLAAFVLCLGLFQPVPVSAANLYFTAINDSVAPLNSGTMPVWSGGQLYVPYTVFDANQNGIGISLGLYTSYSRGNGSNTVTLFNLRQMLAFDLTNNTCRDEMTGTSYNARAIMRGGRPYLPLNLVCAFFGLEYSYNQLPYIPQGYLVRVKSADAVMDDAGFIDRARDLINNRLREYTQSLSPAESTDPPPPVTPSNPGGPADVNGSSVATYLAFRCESAGSLRAILDALDSAGQYALFFLTPQLLEEESGLVRRILGTGHSLGILADGGEDVLPRLEWGNQVLEEVFHTRTTLAYAPAGQREGLEERGWVCWKETLKLSPGSTVSPAAFANSAINRLGTRRRTVFLTMEGDSSTARVLPTLLRQLAGSHYTVAVPMETRL